ncbi:MAG: anti-sigma factor domain-containing protein [Chloroflexota bacterium]
MQHDEAAELLASYALEALSEDEQAAVTEHVARCPTCTAQLAAYRAVISVLPLALEPVAPPRELRRRVLAAAVSGDAGAHGQQRPRVLFFRQSAAGWLTAAALLLAAAGLGGWGVAEHAQLQGAPQIALVAANPGTAASGTVTYLPGRAPAVYVAHLPMPPQNRVYEAWVIHAGRPQAAGIFVTSPDGTGGVVLTAAPASGDKVAITLEAAPGGAVPAGPTVLSGALTT